MKKIIVLSALLASSLVLAGCSLTGGNQGTTPSSQSDAPSISGSPSQNQTQTQTQTPATISNAVSIKSFAFNPGTLTVKKGTTVTWTNNDSAPHQIKSATFNSTSLSQGQSFSFTFNEVGSFDYSCSIHPSMLGKIIVQ